MSGNVGEGSPYNHCRRPERSAGNTSFSKLQSKRFEELRRLAKKVREAEFCDEHFKLRTKSNVDKLIKKSTQEFVANLMEERKRYRSAIEKRIMLTNRRSETEDILGDTLKEINYRDRGRNTKYVSRSELSQMKSEARMNKKARKHMRRSKEDEFLDAFTDSEILELFEDVTHQSSFGNTVHDMGSVMSYIYDKLKHIENVDLVALLIHSIVVFCSETDVKSRWSALMCLAIRLGVSAKDTHVKDLIYNFMTRMKNLVNSGEVVHQSFLGDIGNTINKTLSSDLTYAVRSLVIGLVAYIGLNKDTAQHVFNLIGTTHVKMSILKLVESVISVVVKISEAISLWWHGRDGMGLTVSQILFGESRMTSLRSVYQVLDAYKTSTYYGMPVEAHMERFSYIRMAREFMDTCDTYRTALGSHHPEYAAISSMKMQVLLWYNTLMAEVLADTRIPPFAVIMTGNPGVGKSVTAESLMVRPAVIKGYTFHKSQVYFKNSVDEYWEGYRCMEQNIVFQSELAKDHPDIVKSKGDVALETFLSAVDSNPFSPKMAFGFKGVTKFLAELYLMDTNNPGLNAKILWSAPSAIMRRVVFLEQKVKEEYRKEGSCEIDPTKAMAAENPMEPYLYTFYRNEAVDIKKWNRRDIVVDVGYVEMIRTFDKMFVDHQSRCSKTNDRVKNFVLSIPYAPGPGSPEPLNVFNQPVMNDELKQNPVYGEPVRPPIETGKQKIMRIRKSILEALRPTKETISRMADPMFGTKFVTSILSREKKLVIDKNFDPVGYWRALVADAMTGVFSGFGSDNESDGSGYFSDEDEKLLEGSAIVLAREFKKIYSVFDDWLKEDGVCRPDTKFRSYINNMHCLIDEEADLTEIRENLETFRSRYPNVASNGMYRGQVMVLYWKIRKMDEDSKIDPSDYSSEDFSDTETVEFDVEHQSFFSSLPSFSAMVYGVVKSLIYSITALFFTTWLSFYMNNLTIYNIFISLLIVVSFMSFNFVSLGIVFTLSIGPMMGLVFRWKGWHGYVNFLPSFFAGQIGDALAVFLWRAKLKIYGQADAPVLDSWRRRSKHFVLFAPLYIALSYGLFKIIRSFFGASSGIEEQSVFSKYADNRIVLRETESKCETPQQRVGDKPLNPNWNNLTVIHSKIQHTNGAEKLDESICRKNVFIVHGLRDGDHHSSSMLFGICGKFAIINTHFHLKFRNSINPLYISRSSEGFSKDGTVSLENYRDLGNDITIVETSESFTNRINHFVDGTVMSGDGYIGGTQVSFGFLNELKINGKTLPMVFTYKGFSKVGYCGTPLIADFGNGRACVIGIHVAGDTIGVRGYSVRLSRAVLQKAVDDLKSGFEPYSFPSEGAVYQALDCEIKVNPKSPFKHIPMPNVTFFGTIGKAQVNRSSRVELNCFNKIVPFVEKIMETPRTKEFSAPMMKPQWVNGEYLSPQNNALVYFTKPVSFKNQIRFDRAAEYMTKLLIDRLKNEGVKSLSPFPMEHAINGYVHDAYLRRINASTAAGFRFPGKKGVYINLVENTNDVRVPDKKTYDAIDDIFLRYEAGESSLSPFTVSLKDEPVSVSKARSGQTRLFYVHELPHLIVSRMYLGPIATLIQQSDAFYSMVGINMFMEAGKVWERMTRFPNYIEADAKKFDITAGYVVRKATFKIVHNICAHFGYNETALKYLDGVLSDLLTPLFVLDGDAFIKSSIPSGHYATAELNCLVVMIMMVVLYLDAEDDGAVSKNDTFFDHVSAAYYGDDQSASVSDAVSKYINNLTLANLYAEMNMELTASDKCSELTPFVDIQSATFLKRTIRYSEFAQMYVAPLDLNSIYKMSSLSVKSDSITPSDHAVAVACSALSELFVHCSLKPNPREVYGKLRDAYVLCIQQVFPEIDTKRIFSFEKVCSFLKVDLCPYNIGVREEDVTSSDICWQSDFHTHFTSECVTSVEPCPRFPRYKIDSVGPLSVRIYWESSDGSAQFLDRKMFLLREIEKLSAILSEMKDPSQGLSACALRMTPQYAQNRDFAAYVEDWLQYATLHQAYTSELRLINELIVKSQNDDIIFQSDLGEGYQRDGDINEAVVVDHGVLKEIGGAETKEIEIDNVDVSFMKVNDDLQKFFERPVQIGRYAISTGSIANTAYDVFGLYTLNPNVRAKLKNYSFLRGKICVRISVSGTPFDSGRLIVGCVPYSTNNPVIQQYVGVSQYLPLFNSYLSQQKLSSVIDLKENKPVDFEMPWICPSPVARLWNNSVTVLSSGTKYSDLEWVWGVYINTLNAYRSVAASPSPVYVYVYAYMKDVELGVPTGTLTDIVAQSDERKIGPVEKIASNLAGISDKLHEAPYIGIYARASSFVMRGLAGVASLFGWSAPVIDTMPQRVKNEPFQNGAMLIQRDTGKRLVLDPKQELAISTEYTGQSGDELIIEDLCRKRAYVMTFDWSASTNPLVSMKKLFIHPMLSPFVVTPTGKYVVQPTPMHWVSQLFRKWHGDIVITLEVVCSAFHRGKLLITYEPNIWQHALIGAATDLNKQFTHVWDIQETQRYSICVNWNMLRAWAENLENIWIPRLQDSNTVPTEVMANAVNGFISIAPFTKLQSPDSSDVSINVYIHGENVKFNRLTSEFLPWQRDVVYQSNDQRVTNVDESCVAINPSTVSDEGMYHHFYGEVPLSLRSLLKRFVLVNYSSIAPGGANKRILLRYPIYPVDPHPVGSNGVDAFTYQSVLSHIHQAFLAMRGGMRYRVSIITDGSNNFGPVIVNLRSDNTTTENTITADNTYNTVANLNGNDIFIPDTNAGIEFEVPFYSNNYYVWAMRPEPFDSTVTTWDNNALRSFSIAAFPSGTPTLYGFQLYAATAEDFQLSYFVGAVPFAFATIS